MPMPSSITADRAITPERRARADGGPRDRRRDRARSAIRPTSLADPRAAGARRIDWSPPRDRARARSTRTTTASSRCCAASATTCRSSSGATRRCTATRRGSTAEDMAHRRAVRVRRDAAPRRHDRLRLLLPQRAGQRARDRRRSRPRAGSASGSCWRAASTTGTARRRRTARRSRRRSRTSRRSHARYQDRERFLTTVQPAPHSQHGATPAMIEAGAGCARDAGVPWHIHLAEERYQVDQSLERFGARPLHAVAALPVDLATMIAVHGCWFDDARARAARRARRLPRLLPGLEHVPRRRRHRPRRSRRARRARRPRHRRRLLEQPGQRVRRDADGGAAAEGPPHRRPGDRRRDLLRARARAPRARSCGCRSARIAPGYRCDLVALDLDDPSLWPAQALEKNVVYALSPRAITDVVVDGQEVVVDAAT